MDTPADTASDTDELLGGIWEQVAILRGSRIAHRDLRRANVFVAEVRPTPRSG
jgi:hypothetical protein